MYRPKEGAPKTCNQGQKVDWKVPRCGVHTLRTARQQQQQHRARSCCQNLHKPFAARGVGSAAINQCGDHLGMNLQTRAHSSKWRGNRVIETKRAAAHKHPGVVEEAAWHPPGQNICCRDADETCRVGAPRHSHVTAFVEWDETLRNAGCDQLPRRLEQAISALQRDVAVIRAAHECRDAQCGVRLSLEAYNRGQMAYKTVARDARCDMAGICSTIGRAQCREVAKITGRCPKRRRAGRPIERAPELTDDKGTALL